ncbi:MAG: ABC transporter permease subunit [Alphaproteobacteria bacterium]
MSATDDTAGVLPPDRPPRPWPWEHGRWRGLLLQAAVLAAVVGVLGWFAANAWSELRSFGYGFMDNTSGFEISFKLTAYSRESSYWGVLVVGLLNTLLVAGLGIVLATLLGFVVGIARLSPNWIVSRLAAAYVEFVRNVPLLLWILFFYLALLPTLPPAKQAISVGGSVFLSNRGLYVPKLHWGEGAWTIPLGLAAGILAAVLFSRWARARQQATGKRPPDLLLGAAAVVGLPLLAFFAAGMPVSLEFPELKGFNFRGGLAIQPELVALVLALTIYTATYIAEIVRSGIEGVSKGQSEAASALGLSRGQRLRLVVIPQAMRIIVPPLTSQYLNLTKNSSLATAIAYPDLVAVFAGTALAQAGREIEILGLTAAIYLTLSLLTSLAMNLYNRRTQLRER